MSRTDSLTAPFGFFGDGLFGSADRASDHARTRQMLDNITERSHGIEVERAVELGGIVTLRDNLVADYIS